MSGGGGNSNAAPLTGTGSREPSPTVSAASGFDPSRVDTALRVMRVFNSFDGPSCDGVWWRTDGEYAPVTMLVNCNDLFYWGCADCEQVTADNVERLEETVREVAGIDEIRVDDASLLWVARVRGMRPQGAFYKHLGEKLHHLFDACGPVREAGFGNPVSRDSGSDRNGEDAGTAAECAASQSGQQGIAQNPPVLKD